LILVIEFFGIFNIIKIGSAMLFFFCGGLFKGFFYIATCFIELIARQGN